MTVNVEEWEFAEGVGRQVLDQLLILTSTLRFVLRKVNASPPSYDTFVVGVSKLYRMYRL
jgi:hypothetical protein